MQELSSEEILKIAQSYLDRVHPGGATLTVQPDSLNKRETWWYLDVLSDKPPVHRHEFYEALADAAVDIEERENVNLFFQLLPTDAVDQGLAA